jgi:hypothetical protein
MSFHLPVDFEDAMKLVLSGCLRVDRETKLPVEALGDTAYGICRSTA